MRLYDSSREKVYPCQIWIWVPQGCQVPWAARESELGQEVKAAETRETPPRKQGLQKQGCRMSAEVLSHFQLSSVDKIQDFSEKEKQ